MTATNKAAEMLAIDLRALRKFVNEEDLCLVEDALYQLERLTNI